MNVEIDDELALHAQLYTADVQATLTRLLNEFIAIEVERRTGSKDRLKQQLEAWNEFHAEHGLLSDEFSTL